jgi:general secretion pathway protein G
MIELVFVIVIMGILASVALPKMAASRTDAQIAKGRSDIASIRSSIVSERQTRLLKGQNSFINKLHDSNTLLFDTNGSSTLMMYGVATKPNSDGHWQPTPSNSTGNWRYVYRIMGVDVAFDYNQSTGTFDCTHSVEQCKYLTE